MEKRASCVARASMMRSASRPWMQWCRLGSYLDRVRVRVRVRARARARAKARARVELSSQGLVLGLGLGLRVGFGAYPGAWRCARMKAIALCSPG